MDARMEAMRWAQRWSSTHVALLYKAQPLGRQTFAKAVESIRNRMLPTVWLPKADYRITNKLRWQPYSLAPRQGVE